MTAPSIEEALLTGFAALIASWGGTSYDPDAADSGVHLKVQPDQPDRTVTLAVVVAYLDPFARWGQGVLQVRYRGLPGDPLDVDALGGPITLRLNGSAGLVFDGVTVNTVENPRSLPAGRDQATRELRVDQFDIDFDLAPEA